MLAAPTLDVRNLFGVAGKNVLVRFEPAVWFAVTRCCCWLQVTGGDQRVDVRLTERAGEVQVSVRTPDSQLAGALRDDLAALSARLEQSGFRAECLPTKL